MPRRCTTQEPNKVDMLHLWKPRSLCSSMPKEEFKFCREEFRLEKFIPLTQAKAGGGYQQAGKAQVPAAHHENSGGRGPPHAKGQKGSGSAQQQGKGNKGFSGGKQQAANTSKPLSPQEYERRREHGLCTYCGKEGHFRRDCPVAKSQDDRKHAPVSNVKGSKGSKGSKGRGRGKSSGKGRGRGKSHGPVRQFDAHEYGDPDHAAYDEYKHDDYGHYDWHYDDAEEEDGQDPQVGVPAQA